MADQSAEKVRITVDAHEWSVLRSGPAPKVEEVIDRLVARARAEALREAADDAYATFMLGRTLGMPTDIWLRERADRLYPPEMSRSEGAE